MSYTPTQWKAGDTVTSAKLNKMEQGIVNGNSSLKIELDENYLQYISNGGSFSTLDDYVQIPWNYNKTLEHLLSGKILFIVSSNTLMNMIGYDPVELMGVIPVEITHGYYVIACTVRHMNRTIYLIASNPEEPMYIVSDSDNDFMTLLTNSDV